jgi:dihydroorotase
MNRRHFIKASLLPAASHGLPARGAARFDTVIRGGRITDPARGLFDRELDVGLSAGRIAAVGRNLPTGPAEVVEARGLLVVPGLIDIHVHARDAAFPPAEYLRTGGVTSLLDAGSRGADNLDDVLALARNAPNRMRLWLNISRLGNFPGGRAEFLDGLDYADVAKARAALTEKREWIVGVKARLSRSAAAGNDLAVLQRALEVAAPLGVPIMVHVGDTASPLPAILALLRPGDIVTHMYAPAPNGILDGNGTVLPQVRQARRRGVRFDFGHGRTEHWKWDVAARALKQGFPPDTISSDLDIVGRTVQVFDLPNVLSKFLVLGMPLRNVIACATSNAAQSVRELNTLGTLRPGAPADITLLELTHGTFDFTDNYGTIRQGTQRLVTRGAWTAGKRAV